MLNKKKLFEVIAKALEIPVNQISIESSSVNIENWDSLGHLSILTSLEKESKEISSINDLVNAYSVKSIVDILTKNKYLK